MERKEAEKYRAIQLALNELAKPFVQAKVDILSRSIPTMRLYPDGRLETSYSPEVTAMLNEIDTHWQELSRLYITSTVA